MKIKKMKIIIIMKMKKMKYYNNNMKIMNKIMK